MKTIILTCTSKVRDHSGFYPYRERFLIEIDEATGDAQIVKESAARVDRDRSACHQGVDLAVEVAP